MELERQGMLQEILGFGGSRGDGTEHQREEGGFSKI